MASEDKKIGAARMGPGGAKCYCCGPGVGKDKRKFERAVKRHIRQLWKKRIKDDLASH